MNGTSSILESLKNTIREESQRCLHLYRPTSEKERVLFIKVLQKKFDHLRKSQLWSASDKGVVS